MMNEDEDDIHYTKKKLETALKRIGNLRNGPIAIEFLRHMKAKGLSDARVLKYANCLPRILENIDILNTEKQAIEQFILEINNSTYKAWTKHGYKIAIKKIIQFVKCGNVDKETPYPEAVSWIKLHISETELEKESRISAEKLLTEKDILNMLRVTRSPRDEAMLSVIFEGAFRPGELLSMTVGSVQFMKDYCVVTTRGKTGQKRMPLVISYGPLLKWLLMHPFRNDTSAPLWCAMDTSHKGHRLTYTRFWKLLKKIQIDSNVKKDIWPYLYRHSQLTRMADKLTDSKLKLFAGWTMDSKMVRKYVHWSGRDLDNSVLAIHGLGKREEDKEHVLEQKICLRCNMRNPPSSPRCEGCGFILDAKIAQEVEDDLRSRISKLEDLIRGPLGGSNA
jgi:integrase/recombinase XerD